MDFLIGKRAAQFPDAARARKPARARRTHPQVQPGAAARLLEQLERKLTENGVQVHWAENAGRGQRIIIDIARDHSTKLMVKGKSMVSEEIELNHAMAEAPAWSAGATWANTSSSSTARSPRTSSCRRSTRPSSRSPACSPRKCRAPATPTTVDELIGIGRAVLREKFMTAEIGLSGVNFAVAETGTLCLVENEGNGRMCTTVPDVHIAITGIEKVSRSSNTCRRCSGC
jgi:L-lactate dehydrogenase complex protein LldF